MWIHRVLDASNDATAVAFSSFAPEYIGTVLFSHGPSDIQMEQTSGFRGEPV